MDGQDHIVEEHVTFACGSHNLEGILAYPSEGTPSRRVLVLSPHPHLGGTMENNVVQAVARAVAEDGCVSLRFNYSGIGQSEIFLPPEMSIFDHYASLEDVQRYGDLMPDASAAYDFLTRAVPGSGHVSLVGYSLGAILAYMLAERKEVDAVVAVSPPLKKVNLVEHVKHMAPGLMLGGDEDFAFAPELAKAVIAEHQGIRFEHLTGCDHFFRGNEHRVAEAAIQVLAGKEVH